MESGDEDALVGRAQSALQQVRQLAVAVRHNRRLLLHRSDDSALRADSCQHFLERRKGTFPHVLCYLCQHF